MKFVIERAAALAAMNRVGGLIPAKHGVPIVTHVAIEAFADGAVVFRGTDLDTICTVTADALVSEPGGITVPGEMFRELVKRAPEGSDLGLQLETAPVRLRVQSGRSRWVLPTLPISDFTAFRDPDWEAIISMPANVLANMLTRSRFAAAAATDSAKYFLAGVHLAAHGDEMHAVAMQGHQLAFLKADRPAGWLEDFGVTIPHALLDEILSALTPEKGNDIHLHLSRRAAGVIAGRAVIVGKVIDGKFVDYLRIMEMYESKAVHAVTVPVAALKAAVGRAVAICSPKDRAVKLHLQPDNMSITARGDSSESGDAVSARRSGEETTLGFNADYLIEALDALTDDVAEVRYPMDGEGCRLSCADDPDTVIFLGQRRI